MKRINKATMKMISSSMKNLKKGKVGSKFDPKEFPDIIKPRKKLSKLSAAIREILVDLCAVLPSAKKALKKFDKLHKKG